MIRLRGVHKSYQVGSETIVGLQDVSIDLDRGELVCLRGASGSGKTTLLLSIGGMQRPTSGTVGIADSHDIYAINQAERTRVRARHIGFVFQLFHLLPYLNVQENIQLGAISCSNSREEVDALVEKLGLEHRYRHSPAQLSVGECQRVAIARALISHPDVILADEPTGNLDAKNAAVVMDIFQEFCQSGGTLLLATHSEKSAAFANRLLTIEEGVVKEETATVR